MPYWMDASFPCFLGLFFFNATTANEIHESTYIFFSNACIQKAIIEMENILYNTTMRVYIIKHTNTHNSLFFPSFLASARWLFFSLVFNWELFAHASHGHVLIHIIIIIIIITHTHIHIDTSTYRYACMHMPIIVACVNNKINI